MTNKYPSLKEALSIWEDGIKARIEKPYGFEEEEEYRFHTIGVASAAQKIALQTTSMDPEKAYILGLLHDYGKIINEKIEKVFHGKVGYEEMQNMGYDDVAKICLTHTFPHKTFNDEDFSYPKEWKDWARNTLKNIKYDDYDRLICLCDKFFEGLSVVSIEKRVEGIKRRYNIDEKQIEYFKRESIKLKKYFDKMTGADIYELMNIK